MSTTKQLSLLATQLCAALACYCLGEESPENILQMAQELGISEGLSNNLAKGTFSIGNALVVDKFKEDGKKFLGIANHDYEKAMRDAYEATFKDMEEKLHALYNEKESGAEKLLRLMLNKNNIAHEDRQNLVDEFIKPLHDKLTERDEIQQMLDKHKFLDTEDYLRKTIEEVLPAYTSSGNETTQQFITDATALFKSLFRHNFLQQMKHNENARTVYFCSLLEANLQYGKINEQLIRQVISELGISSKKIEDDFSLLIQYITELKETIKQEAASIIAAIAALNEPRLHDNDWSGRITEYTVSYLFNYKYQYTRFIGRNTELSRLLEFAQHDSSDSRFVWWMITGPGGMGKSRLALEAARILRNMGYHAGFYDLNSKTQHNWHHWTVSRPTFIVIDYALADFEKIKSLIIDLKKYERQLLYPVRLLLIERQLSTEWEQEITRGGEVMHSRYQQGNENNVMVLPNLKDHLWDIMKQVIHDSADETIKHNLLTQKEELLKQLGKIDDRYRPLFCIFRSKGSS